ncbi:hypothetical protein D9619_012668 [Psilocybe cf. subviscida]|uniref:Uncharacterized protein n=1 Tax=Psilocybe cf. subviscida TaxID=2480587 RepID=A0A8H5EZ68_9AGAR|nr:hypothetical protein D9619_012668 [Psilocybe cf. subviscida]
MISVSANQALPPTIAHSLASLPGALQPFAGMFWAHVGLVGGCTKFPGFRERLETELRALAPVGCDVRVWGGAQDKADPITTAYRAACSFASSSSSSSSQSTAASSYPILPSEYLETGGSQKGGATDGRREETQCGEEEGVGGGDCSRWGWWREGVRKASRKTRKQGLPLRLGTEGERKGESSHTSFGSPTTPEGDTAGGATADADADVLDGRNVES